MTPSPPRSSTRNQYRRRRADGSRHWPDSVISAHDVPGLGVMRLLPDRPDTPALAPGTERVESVLAVRQSSSPATPGGRR